MTDQMPKKDSDYEGMIADLKRAQFRFWGILGALVLAALIALSSFYGPVIKPWKQERMGLANLRKAEYTNQIRAEGAAAERDAAVLRAKAIEIVGDVAKRYPEYRNQELIGGFAKGLESGAIKQTFYVITKDNIPVLPVFAAPESALQVDLSE